MAEIIEFKFVSSSLTIELNGSTASTRPTIKSEIAVADVTLGLLYEIATPGVNLEIVNPQKTHEMIGTEHSFRKTITFRKKDTGTKKDFVLKVTANTDTDTDEARISVKYE